MSSISVPANYFDFGYLKSIAIETLESVPKLFSSLLAGAGRNLEGRERMVGVLLVVLGSHVYYWQVYSFWSRRNVKTPTPLPVLGNFISFLTNPRQLLHLKWRQKYGKVYGYYVGTKPYLVCADANVLKQICIKDFDKFQNHFFIAVENKYQKHFLINQKYDHWRGMRSVMSPTFASGKIKHMFKLLDGCAEDLVKQQHDLIAQSGGQVVTIDTKPTFGALGIGSALSSFYGINLHHANANSGKKNDTAVYTRDGMAVQSKTAFAVSPFRYIVSSLLPIRLLRWLQYPLFSNRQMEFLYKTSRNIINDRLKSGKRFNDYLQLLIESKADSELEIAESDKHEAHHAFMADGSNKQPKDTGSSKIKLTDDEVTCQTMMMMVVATETTSTLMSQTIYLLAHHPEVQERLYRELSAIMIRQENGKSSCKLEYEQLTSCQYLDCVISESLRLTSPAIAMDREANADYLIKDYNIRVPEGTTIMLDYFAIQRDPEYWPEPEKFDPERFAPENKAKIVPGSYCPFGIGPRSCIGFRFALTEAKIAIARFITEFKVERAPGTVYPPEPARIAFVINESLNLLVNISRRH